MKLRFLVSLIAWVALASFLAAGVEKDGTYRHDRNNVSISIDKDWEDTTPMDCGDLRVRFEGDDAEISEERIEIPAGGTLEVNVEKRGGVYVQAGSGGSYTARLCKAFAPGTSGAWMRDVRFSLQANRLTVVGPSREDWVGYLVIDAPRGASMNVTASHAPIAFHQVSGTFNATATNGPISVKNSDGTVLARTTNGPISFAGNSGDITLTAVNGPVSVKLSGEEWRGRGLTAETKNGPVSVKLPEEFRSAVRISGSRGPWSCQGQRCEGVARISDDDVRTLTLGEGDPVIKISTTNGPVSIKTK